MTTYDSIVAGSGVSGLTAALLLAMNGRKVLLLEKAPRIGGALARFTREGIPFDTGFHFAGGLTANGVLRQMLTVLGLRDDVEPEFMAPDRAHRFVFESRDTTIDLPCGFNACRKALKGVFPTETTAVDAYFDRIALVRSRTAGMDLSRIDEPSRRLPEETVSLKTVLDGLTGNDVLKGVLCGLGMCYGVKPSEVSFASHARVCYDMYESTARLRNGGDALIRAFAKALRSLDVDIRCQSWITECREIVDDMAQRFVLNSGEEIAARSAVLTIHPRHILDILPRHHISKAFVDRVESFEPSAGFFTVYGVLEGDPDPDFGSSVLSLFPTMDFDCLLDPAYRGETALVVCGTVEHVRGRRCQVVTAFEPSFAEHVAAWQDSRLGCRPPSYVDYKAARVDGIRRHLARYDARYRERFRVLDAASPLTFRDYLHSPDGSAYGIKQKVGQYNLVGRLPIRNLFAAGQSAVLPGVAGAMMSSFIVIRSVVGKDGFNRFVSTRLCN